MNDTARHGSGSRAIRDLRQSGRPVGTVVEAEPLDAAIAAARADAPA
jgi:hypothetical protein